MSDFEFFRSSKNIFENVSDEDNISDDEVKGNDFRSSRRCEAVKDEYESVNQDGTSAWSSVFEETKDLIRVHENRRSSFCQSVNHEDKKVSKGSRIKSKPKFSFGFCSEASMPLPTEENENSIDVHQNVEGLEELEHGGKEHSMTELLKGLQQSEYKEVKVIERPVAELLENLLESHGQQRGTAKMNKETKVRRSALTFKRNRSSSLSYSTLDNGDHIEPMGVSSDEEAEKVRLQVYDEDRIKIETLEFSGRTMTDKFQEVINAAAVNDQGMLLATSKQTGCGYFSRLQQVMQTEKERHMEFLNQSRGAIPRDEARFLDVKILSRYLDAKLTVCQCLLSQNASLSSQSVLNSQIFNEDIEVKRIVIFSSRICNNVDLEVGNMIRIHPPWKVVEVPSKDGGIILCTYFSQIFI